MGLDRTESSECSAVVFIECAFPFDSGRSTILLTRINCADWSDICTKQNVTAFPVVKLYKEGESPVSYAGMLATKDLLKFIQL
jgi:hypothetical protein